MVTLQFGNIFLLGSACSAVTPHQVTTKAQNGSTMIPDLAQVVSRVQQSGTVTAAETTDIEAAANQRAALYSFAYDVGCGAFERSAQ